MSAILSLGPLAQRRDGRSRRARSRRRSCRPSGSWVQIRLPSRADGPPRLCSVCRNLVGSKAAISRSSIAGRRRVSSVHPNTIAEFVRLKVDVIVTHATANILAAKHGTSAIPIVFAAVADPVGIGVVDSLARPGGNITGLSNQFTDAAGKRVELLHEVVPGLRRLAFLANVGVANAALELAEVQAAARTLGLEVAPFDIRRTEDIAPAFVALKARAEALYVFGDPVTNTNRARISALALDARLPTASGFREIVEVGGLMSY